MAVRSDHSLDESYTHDLVDAALAPLGQANPFVEQSSPALLAMPGSDAIHAAVLHDQLAQLLGTGQDFVKADATLEPGVVTARTTLAAHERLAEVAHVVDFAQQALRRIIGRAALRADGSDQPL